MKQLEQRSPSWESFEMITPQGRLPRRRKRTCVLPRVRCPRCEGVQPGAVLEVLRVGAEVRVLVGEGHARHGAGARLARRQLACSTQRTVLLNQSAPRIMQCDETFERGRKRQG